MTLCLLVMCVLHSWSCIPTNWLPTRSILKAFLRINKSSTPEHVTSLEYQMHLSDPSFYVQSAPKVLVDALVHM